MRFKEEGKRIYICHLRIIRSSLNVLRVTDLDVFTAGGGYSLLKCG
jgi:hypothetical protein